ncbi:MAG TPA: cupin domain-containing protein [Gaiellaceae bacterium]|nr:cupin domain-containing protein [Gaiellaceae bacterium]
MQMTRNSLETGRGPADWFTGEVYVDTIAAPSAGSRLGAALVHFTPGARTAWHTHPHGQTIWVSEGVGVCQREGGPIELIRAGDRVFFEPGENHWHGAHPTRFMAHVAMQEADAGGSPVTWGEHVSDEQYAQVPPIKD